MNKKNKNTLIIVIVAVLVVAGGFFLFTGKSQKTKLYLSTAKVTRTTLSNTVTATGNIKPVTEVEVGTQVSGIIDKLYVDYNDQVKAGQVIAEMDKINLKAELASAQAQLASSKSEFEYQSKNYARSKVLYQKKLISDSDYETATYDYDKAKATYNQSQAAMVKVKRNLEYATITSPIDGVVIDRAVEAGQTVAAGFSTPTLFTIAADLTKMQVVADVDEADIGSVAIGQRVTFTVDAYPNDTFEGKVEQIRLGSTSSSSSSSSNSSSSSSSSSSSTVVTYEVVVSAENPDLKLKPRLTANITIYTLERPNALAIPTKALRFVADESLLAPLGYIIGKAQSEVPTGKRLVWIKSNKKIMPKIISVGTASSNQTEVTEGLKEGEEVITELTAEQIQSQQATTEKSPFMPTPPGNNRKNNKNAK